MKSEEAAAVSTEVGSEEVVPGTVAGLVGDLASGFASGFVPDLPADFEFKFNKLRLGSEFAPWLVAPLDLGLELMLASGFETNPALDSASEFAPVFSSVFLSVFSSTSAANFASDWDIVAAPAD